MTETAALKHVRIYSDGACSGNPGPGGYGVVLLYNSHRREFSGGFAHTTNNRMELLGAITGLEALKERCLVRLYSDSIYVINGMRKGWAKKWRANGWLKADKKPAVNTDLWSRLLDLAEQHEVTFEWVRGHSGDPENERADRLAVEAGQRPDNPPDPGFVRPD
jgi:ribonuclease HI